MRTLSLLLSIGFGLLGPGRALACEERSSVADIDATIDALDAAYARADSPAFDKARRDLGPLLDCADEVLPRSLIARVHRARAFAAFADRDLVVLTYAFSAAKVLEPEFRFPPDLLPPSHPLQQHYDEAPLDLTSIPFTAPREGYLLLDGSATEERPANRAVVMQFIAGKGEVVATSYLLPEDRFPPPGILDYGGQEEPVRPTRNVTPWWIAAASSAGLGAATYGVAATRRSAYESAAPIDKPGLRTQTNTLVQASAGLGGIAIGAAVVAIVQRGR